MEILTVFITLFVLAWIGVCFLGGFIFDEIGEKLKKWKNRNKK